MEAFRVDDLVVEYSGLRVLDGISLAVEQGEFFSLIGPSGCGKTTFLHALAGLCQPSAGQIETGDGELGAALVFQRPTLMPWRTVLDNALFGLECRGPLTDDHRRRGRALLESMGLGAHLDDHPHQLSEGMKQRVNLARALLVEPTVLLLDEPFAALDVMTRRQLQDELLDRCRATGITAVLVSHSLEEVAYLSDRVAVLSDKPTRLIGVRPMEQPHPRAQGAEARLVLLQAVEALGELLAGG
jgi:NitT/TauT family transport system ATP-binding protein